jgi:hypothetical protein
MTVNPRRFYVYAYLRTDGTPYYIGKGTRYRIQSRNHVAFVPSKERRKVLFQGLTNEEALDIEIALIHCLGRKDLGTGCLRNQTGGGDGGTLPSPALKAAKSRALKGRAKPPSMPKALSETNMRAGAKKVGVPFKIWESLTYTQRAHSPVSAAKMGLSVAEYVALRLPEWKLGDAMDNAAARHGVPPEIWRSLTQSQRDGCTVGARRRGLTVPQYIERMLPEWTAGGLIERTAAKHSLPAELWAALSLTQRNSAVSCAKRKGLSVLEQIGLMAQDWGVEALMPITPIA